MTVFLADYDGTVLVEPAATLILVLTAVHEESAVSILVQTEANKAKARFIDLFMAPPPVLLLSICAYRFLFFMDLLPEIGKRWRNSARQAFS